MSPRAWLLLAWCAVMLALRFEAARTVDFGDAEALYASYSYYPALSYLDHPGLIGQLYRQLGTQAERVHLWTTLLSTLLPWLLVAALRFAWPNTTSDIEAKERSLRIALWFSTVPVIAIGLFALTPDWPLCLCVLPGLAFALRAEHDAQRRGLHRFAAGLLLGLACYAKLSGLAFVLALLVLWLRRRGERLHLGWLGLGLGLLPLASMLEAEAGLGFPMLRHRLAPSADSVLRGLGMLSGGQLLYLSPLAALLIGLFAWRALRDRAAGEPLWVLVVVPALVLTAAALLSPQTEPHWLAPLLLPLAFLAQAPSSAPTLLWRPRLVAAGFGLAALCSLLVYLWVLVPASARLWPGDPRHNLARELFGQRVLQSGLLRTAQDLEASYGVAPTFVGPHWTLCARLRLVLPSPNYEVGCRGTSDWQRWADDAEARATLLVLVTDDRFEELEPQIARHYTQVSRERVQVFRGGTLARSYSWRAFVAGDRHN